MLPKTRAMASLAFDRASMTATITGDTPATALVVFCHGLGDTSQGWTDACGMLSQSLPHVKFVLPTAPVQPVSLNGGMPMPSWYDIKGLDDRANETCDGIDSSRATIEAILEEEDFPADRTVLAGFSQGGALSLYTGLQRAEPVAGVVCMSGYLAAEGSVEPTEAALTTTPVLMCHGDADPMVRPAWAEHAKEWIEGRGASVEFHWYPGLEHSANMEELRDVAAFLTKVLPPSA